MYKALGADDFKKHLGLPADYHVDGFVTYGTWFPQPYEMLRARLRQFEGVQFGNRLPRYLADVLAFRLKDKHFWFVTSYGGALLSEYVHLACLFGSKKNIVMGSCGGLLPQGSAHDIIIPTYSYGNESTTRAYARGLTTHKHMAETSLSNHIAQSLRSGRRIWRGPTTTFQAVLGETWADVMAWSQDGYFGVDMETATMFAISNHFNVPCASILMIDDNLIKGESMVDDKHMQAEYVRQEVVGDMFDAVLKVL